MKRSANTLVWPVSTLLLALMLSILPMPGATANFRPDWTVLVMIFWLLNSPDRFGLLTAMFLGLALDTLSGALLGQNALAMVIIAYLVLKFHLRLRISPISQLTVTVFGLLVIYHFVLFWVDGVSGRTVPYSERWMPLMMSTFLWPLIQRALHQKYSNGRAEV